jgi:hypothetical protein
MLEEYLAKHNIETTQLDELAEKMEEAVGNTDIEVTIDALKSLKELLKPHTYPGIPNIPLPYIPNPWDTYGSETPDRIDVTWTDNTANSCITLTNKAVNG